MPLGSIMVPCGKMISLATDIGGVVLLDNWGWLIGESVLDEFKWGGCCCPGIPGWVWWFFAGWIRPDEEAKTGSWLLYITICWSWSSTVDPSIWMFFLWSSICAAEMDIDAFNICYFQNREYFVKFNWESRIQIPAELISNLKGFCSFFFNIAWFLMIFISFSSPWTKTIILLLHSVKVLEPYRIQSAHVQGYVKLKMDSVEGWFLKVG